MMTQEEFDARERVKALFGVEDVDMGTTDEPKEIKEFTSLELTDTGACPICDAKVRKDYEDFMEYTLCEYRYVCDRCGLSSSYAYGNYETYIDEFGWGHTHNTNPKGEQMKQEQKEQEFVARLYRKMIVEQEELTAEEDALLEELAKTIAKRYSGEIEGDLVPNLFMQL